MQTTIEETKKKVAKLHIQDGRTIASLAAEYGICHATVSNWIRVLISCKKRTTSHS